MANQTAAQKAKSEAEKKALESEKEEASTHEALSDADVAEQSGLALSPEPEPEPEPEPTTNAFVTTHNGDFYASGVEFKKGQAVELTKEQQELPAIASSIKNGMLKAV